MNSKKPNGGIPEDYLSSLLNRVPFGIVALDPGGNLILANDMACSLLQPEQVKGNKEELLEWVRNIPAVNEKLFGSGEGKEWESFDLEESWNGRTLNIRGRVTPGGFILIFDDISRLKEMEANAVQAIITGLENERSRLAREIHDGIGPLLASVKLELDSFIDDYNSDSPAALEARLHNIRQTIDSVSSDLRDLSHHLMPRLLEEFGLFSAFTNLVNRINLSSRPNVEFYSNLTSEDRFDKEIELNLYRCGQELLNNAVKHAGAVEILVQVIRHDQSIVLMVEDDGRGFERSEQVPGDHGIGLSNIEARVRSVNGEFVLESMREKGTTASIEIPLNKTPVI